MLQQIKMRAAINRDFAGSGGTKVIAQVAPLAFAFTATGAGSQIVPAGMYNMVGEAWGSGASGGGVSSGTAPGGGGGGYSRSPTIAVTPGQTIYYNVAAGGAATTGNGNNGSASWVNPAANSQPVANGCVGGGGTGASSGNPAGGAGTIGTTNFTGGAGRDGNPIGGGGGGGAGSAGNGGDAPGTPNVAAPGAAGSPDGGAGGTGVGNGGTAGTQPGGGGGGAFGGLGAKGGDGKVRLTFLPPSSEVGIFLARTSGLDATHVNAYTDLINGLVTDGIWSKLDVLHIYATQDSTTALLNLVSTSYNGTTNGSPTFTTDRGYTGVDASSTVYIDTGFNPSTASSPQYVLASAHLSMWNLTNAPNDQPALGCQNAGNTQQLFIINRNTGGHSYVRLNCAGFSGESTNPNNTGHFCGTRSGTGQSEEAYSNGSALTWGGSREITSALASRNMYSLGINVAGTALGCGQQNAMISIGSNLSAGEVANFYTRLRTYMTAVGVP